MSLEEIYKKEFGEDGWKKLNPQVKTLFVRIDKVSKELGPVTSRQLREALR